MIRPAVSAEGHTAVAFATSVLRDHLWPMKIMPYALLLGRVRDGGGGRGDVTVARLVDDMRRWRTRNCSRSLASSGSGRSKRRLRSRLNAVGVLVGNALALLVRNQAQRG